MPELSLIITLGEVREEIERLVGVSESVLEGVVEVGSDEERASSPSCSRTTLGIPASTWCRAEGA